MSTKREIQARFQKYLKQKWLEHVNQRGEIVDQADWARELGVSATSLNQWINGNRVPAGENVQILARSFGREVFDVLELEPQFVVDEYTAYIATRIANASADTRQKIDKILDDAEALQGRNGARKPNNQNQPRVAEVA